MKVFEIETRQVLLLREPVSLMGQCVYIKGWKDQVGGIQYILGGHYTTIYTIKLLLHLIIN